MLRGFSQSYLLIVGLVVKTYCCCLRGVSAFILTVIVGFFVSKTVFDSSLPDYVLYFLFGFLSVSGRSDFYCLLVIATG